jgi:hypothetical protein
MESSVAFDVFHVVGTRQADASCDVVRSRDVPGLEFRGNLDRYCGRPRGAPRVDIRGGRWYFTQIALALTYL